MTWLFIQETVWTLEHSKFLVMELVLPMLILMIVMTSVLGNKSVIELYGCSSAIFNSQLKHFWESFNRFQPSMKCVHIFGNIIQNHRHERRAFFCSSKNESLHSIRLTVWHLKKEMFYIIAFSFFPSLFLRFHIVMVMWQQEIWFCAFEWLEVSKLF